MTEIIIEVVKINPIATLVVWLSVAGEVLLGGVLVWGGWVEEIGVGVVVGIVVVGLGNSCPEKIIRNHVQGEYSLQISSSVVKHESLPVSTFSS